MKRLLLVALSIITTLTASATYVPVTVSGFTDDIVANGSGTALSSTTNTADGGIGTNAFVFMDATYSYLSTSPTTYLPTGGTINTVVASTPGLQFQLASYTANNDLRLQSNASGTLTFATPQSASQLFLAAFCGNGNIPMNVTVNFTDGTTQVMSSVTVQDWFGNTGFCIQGVGRASQTGGGIQNNTTDPRIYQIQYAINAANYSKLIASLSISTGTSANNPTYATLGVMAVSINTPLAVTVTPSLTSACNGQAVTFTAVVTGTTGTVTYQWKKNGVNVGLNQSTYTDNTLLSTDVITVTVTPSSSTAFPATVTSTNLSIPTGSVPVAPTAITGSNPICINSTNTYTVPAVTGATGYIWTIPTGWSAPSLNGISISPTAGITGGTMTVAATNGCGTGPISSLAVSVVSNATPAVTISNVAPGSTICAGNSVTFTATPTNGGATPSYQWKKNGSNVGSNAATYTDAALVNGDQITVVMTSSLGCSTTSTGTSSAITMTVNSAPPQPGTISGSAAVCNGTSQSYSIAAVTGATGYTWTAPTGWTGSSTSPNINYTTSANGGNVTVTANNACGNSAPRTLAVVSTSTPSTPGGITGNVAPCAFSSQTYSVGAVSGATTYTWSLPTGWSGGSSTTSITATTTNSSGNVTVTAGNVCGTSAAASLAVAAFTSTNAPGAITGSATPCSGTTQVYSVAAVPGATSYNWQLPGGWGGFSSTNSITVTTTTGGGQVQVSANNSCGFSSPATLAVAPVLSVTPSVVVTTPTTNVCQTNSASFTANPSGGGPLPTYQWKKNGVIIPGATGVVYTDNFLVNGDQIVVVMTSNAPCATTTVVTSPAVIMTITATVVPGININTTPPTVNCAGTPLLFTTNINGGGTAPVYQWYRNSALINGANGPSYLESAPVSGDTLAVRLTSNAACPAQNTVMSNKVILDIRPNVTPTATITASPGTNVAPSTVVTFTANITNGGTTPTYQWYKNGLPMAFATNSTYTTSGLHDGDLMTVELNSSAPCATSATITSSALRINVSTGVGTVTAAGSNWMGDISIYPNPSAGHFSIAADWGAGHNGERVKIELVNSLGQMIYQSDFVPNAAQWTVPVWLGTEVANGLYQLRVHTDNMGIVRGISVQR